MDVIDVVSVVCCALVSACFVEQAVSDLFGKGDVP